MDIKLYFFTLTNVEIEHSKKVFVAMHGLYKITFIKLIGFFIYLEINNIKIFSI